MYFWFNSSDKLQHLYLFIFFNQCTHFFYTIWNAHSIAVSPLKSYQENWSLVGNRLFPKQWILLDLGPVVAAEACWGKHTLALFSLKPRIPSQDWQIGTRLHDSSQAQSWYHTLVPICYWTITICQSLYRLFCLYDQTWK